MLYLVYLTYISVINYIISYLVCIMKLVSVAEKITLSIIWPQGYNTLFI